MNEAIDYAQMISEKRAAFMNLQAKNFLQKNAIPFTNIEKTNKLLRDKGYRLVDEVEGSVGEDEKHTLLLVKIIDQTSYVLKKPEFTIGE